MDRCDVNTIFVLKLFLIKIKADLVPFTYKKNNI